MAKTRPNLVFVTTDQPCSEALSAHDGLAHTPNLDRLAALCTDLQSQFANSQG